METPKNNVLVLGAALIATALAAAAQSKPDLSGTWKADIAKSNFGALPAPQSSTTKVDHKEPNLKVIMITVGNSGERTYELAFTTDGKENTNYVGNTELKSKCTWDGAALLMEHSANAGEVKLTDKWSLSEDGHTLTMVRKWSGSQGETTQTIVSTRQ